MNIQKVLINIKEKIKDYEGEVYTFYLETERNGIFKVKLATERSDLLDSIVQRTDCL